MEFVRHQQQAIQKRMEQTGRCADLLFFYAIRGEHERFHELGRGPARAHEQDALTYQILALRENPEQGKEVLARFADNRDPYWGYCLAKHFLGCDDLPSALMAAKILLEGDRMQVMALNLVAKWLALHKQTKVALDVLRSSLCLNADQRDLILLQDALLRRQPVTIELYLGVVPKPMDIAFYVPVYNGEQYLRETIEALMCQSYPLAEILIVDDGSSDGTAEIAREYPVRLIRFSENRGLAAARNAAFQETATSFVGSVDADVCAAPGYTASILSEFENAMPELSGVGGRLIEKYVESEADKWRATCLKQGWYPHRMYFDVLRFPEKDSDIIPIFSLNGSNNVFRREHVLAVGGYDEKYRTNAEDGDICVKLRAAGRHLAFNRNAEAYHSRRDTITSVLRTAWNYGFWGASDSGLYDNPRVLLANIGRGTQVAVGRMHDELSSGIHASSYVDFLSLFQWPLMDLAHACRQGILTPDQGAAIQHAILMQLSILDRRLGGNLYDRVRRDSAHLRIAEWGRDDVLPLEVSAQLQNYTNQVLSVLEGLTPEAYSLLLRQADVVTGTP